jgi:hypothetical protein
LRDAVTCAIHDQKPRFSLREIKEIILSGIDSVTLVRFSPWSQGKLSYRFAEPPQPDSDCLGGAKAPGAR